MLGQQLTITVTQDGITQNMPPVQIEVTATNAPNDPAILTVYVIVQQNMGLSPNAIAFSASAGGQGTVQPGTPTDPTSHVVQVTNTSGGTVAQLGTIGCQPGTRVSCTVDQGEGTVTFTVDPVGLAPGTFNLTANVTASAASNSPQTVAITLTVTP